MNSRHTDDLRSIYWPLRLTYGLVPIVAGLDKFTNLLVDWKTYLPGFAVDLLPVAPETFMHLVGVIEVCAGLLTLTLLPRLGAYIVMAWLSLIAVAVGMGGRFDIAVRDLVMAIGAYTLGQAAAIRGEQWLLSGTGTEGVRTHAPAN